MSQKPIEKYTGTAGERREMRWQFDAVSNGWILFTSAEEPPALVHASGWQPIESAPRDGTPIFAWAKGYELPEVQRFCTDRGTWAEAPGWDYVDLGWEPTHWQPLPPPPGRDDG